MQEGLVFWIIGSFFITTSLAEEIPKKVSELRYKRYFDNFDFINASVAEGMTEKIRLRYIQYRYMLTLKTLGRADCIPWTGDRLPILNGASF